MALNIKNSAVERLAEEVARVSRLRRFPESEAWATVPPEELGRRMTRDEEDQILGYGQGGE